MISAPSSGTESGLLGLMRRLVELPSQSITYYGPQQAVRRSYPGLFADVRAAQERLTDWGIRAGMRVGLLSENSYEWIVHDLALLDLRCVSVCFPVEETVDASLSELCEQYRLNLLLVSERERKRRPGTAPAIGTLEGPTAGETPRLRSEPPDAQLDDDVFTLVFSSGTSGRVKCLLMSREGTEDLIAAYGRVYQFQADDSILMALPLSAFQQRLMVYAAIWYGFSLLLADAPRFFRALNELTPTILAGPPIFYETLENRFGALAAWQRILLTVVGYAIHRLPRKTRDRLLKSWFAPFHKAYGGRIRLMLTGSAPSRRSTLDLFQLLGLPLLQVYGMTETGFVSWNLPQANRLGSVGRLVFEGGARIETDGEIIVCHQPRQSCGYLGAADENQHTFLPDGSIATGDIGHIDSDGYLYITGRKKEILITQGGYKLQPEPIEVEIETCPGVHRAVLFAGEELRTVVALVSLGARGDDQGRACAARTVEKINQRLPSASTISRIVFTTTEFRRDNGLLTRNLKLDRRAAFEHFRAELLRVP